jgi:poly-D-alanine transfer protein DltD
MTESEAIKELQENIDLPFGSNVSKEAAKMAIQALERQEKIKENMTESKAKTILETEIVHHPECSVFSEALSIAIQTLEKQIRKTSVRTKEIVYRFSVLSDRDKDRIISKFQSIKYSKEQNIEILLDQLAQNRLEEEFLNTIKSYGEE